MCPLALCWWHCGPRCTQGEMREGLNNTVLPWPCPRWDFFGSQQLQIWASGILCWCLSADQRDSGTKQTQSKGQTPKNEVRMRVSDQKATEVARNGHQLSQVEESQQVWCSAGFPDTFAVPQRHWKSTSTVLCCCSHSTHILSYSSAQIVLIKQLSAL